MSGSSLLFLFALFASIIPRIFVVMRSSFPLNDGGLFLTMINDLLANRFSLPSFTSYNMSNIPYVYPPFAFFFIALLHRFTAIPVIDLIHYIPVIISSFTIPLVFGIARKLRYTYIQSILGMFLFACTFRSWEWIIMGGGVTRAFGFVFSLLTVYTMLQKKNESLKALVPTGVFLGMTILSHPEFAFFTGTFIIFLTIWKTKSISRIFIVYLISLLIISPWLYIVLLNHGLTPIISAFQSKLNPSATFISLLIGYITDSPYTGLIPAFFILGGMVAVLQKQYIIPLWFILPFVTTPDMAFTATTIPLSLLAITGIYQIFHLIEKHKKTSIYKQIIKMGFVVYIVLQTYFLNSYYASTYKYLIYSPKASDTVSLSWIQTHTDPSSAFIVLTGVEGWYNDALSEWFPALTKRKSILTVQGREWLQHQAFSTTISDRKLLTLCYSKTVSCIFDWSAHTGSKFSHIYIQKQNENIQLSYAFLAYSIETSSRFTKIYEDTGTSIYALK